MLEFAKLSKMVVVASLGWVVLAGCGEAQEATRHDFPVFADGESLGGFENNRDYEIELSSVEAWVERIEFTVGGQAHEEAHLLRFFRNALLPVAHAHPDHSAGGEVAGEFVGPLLVEWRPGERAEIGVGSFLEGDYGGYNLTFGLGGDGEELEGLTMRIVGVARSEGVEIDFIANIEMEPGSEVIGGALQGSLPGQSVAGVGIEFLPFDVHSGRSIFGRVVFSELPTDSEGIARIEPGSLAHADMRNALLAHEYYGGRLIRE